MPPLDSPRGTALEAALFDVTGAKTAGGVLYATDGGWFTGSGITSLICGPGDLEQAHQPNEHIRRDAFERGPAMIHKVVDRLCASPIFCAPDLLRVFLSAAKNPGSSPKSRPPRSARPE